MLLRWLFLLVLVVLPGCSGTNRVVRLDTGWGSPVVHVPRSGQAAELVELDEDEVREAVAQLARTIRPSQRPQEAARRLFEVDPRSGSYLFDVRSRRITPLTPGENPSQRPRGWPRCSRRRSSSTWASTRSGGSSKASGS